MSAGIHPCQDVIHQESNQISASGWSRLLAQAMYGRLAKQADYLLVKRLYQWAKTQFCRPYPCQPNPKKPIIVHTRDAKHDTLEIPAEKAEYRIVHCFTEDYDTAKKALGLGILYFTIGHCHFQKCHRAASGCQKTAQRPDIDGNIDSPYLAPVPKRGKSNGVSVCAVCGWL